MIQILPVIKKYFTCFPYELPVVEFYVPNKRRIKSLACAAIVLYFTHQLIHFYLTSKNM